MGGWVISYSIDPSRMGFRWRSPGVLGETMKLSSVLGPLHLEGVFGPVFLGFEDWDLRFDFRDWESTMYRLMGIG